LYNLFIFNKSGACIYYQDFLRNRPEDADQQKLLFGMLFSLKRFIQRTSPLPDDNGSFHHYTCSNYRLHFYHAPAGCRFVCMSDPKVDSLQDELFRIFTIYVDTCVRNPLYQLNSKITCTLFAESLNDMLKKQKLIL